jgi:hypothetical protein
MRILLSPIVSSLFSRSIHVVLWSVKRRKKYVDWSREVAKGLRGVNQKLEQQFHEAAAAAERSFKPVI